MEPEIADVMSHINGLEQQLARLSEHQLAPLPLNDLIRIVRELNAAVGHLAVAVAERSETASDS